MDQLIQVFFFRLPQSCLTGEPIETIIPLAQSRMAKAQGQIQDRAILGPRFAGELAERPKVGWRRPGTDQIQDLRSLIAIFCSSPFTIFIGKTMSPVGRTCSSSIANTTSAGALSH